ncbi:MAG: type II secretion system protein GspM [Betaproteobacteria bacterium]
MNALSGYWKSRSARERSLWLVVASVVVLVLVVAFAWLPLERSRSRLQAELPRLRASLESMQREAAEAKRLRALPPAGNTKAPVSALAATPAPGTQVTALDANRVRIAGNDAAFTTLMEWIIAAQSSHGLHVESARLDALPAPGRVKADIVLSRS